MQKPAMVERDWTSNDLSRVLAQLGEVLAPLAVSPICVSTNSEGTWIEMGTPDYEDSASVASSADGTILLASGGPGVYTFQTTPTPQLNITPSSGDLLLSWIVPSTNFVLEQDSHLNTTNWTPVTNVPVLILTNLEDQVILASPTGNTFYRLQAQNPEGDQ